MPRHGGLWLPWDGRSMTGGPLKPAMELWMSKQDTSLDNEDDAMVWCLLARITMTPGVYIIPELIYQDNKSVTNNGVTTDEGDTHRHWCVLEDRF